MTDGYGEPGFVWMVAGFAAGVGLFLAGLLNLSLRRTGAWVRAGFAAGACGLAGGGAWAVAESGVAAGVAAGSAAAGLLLAGGGAWLTSAVAAAVRRPGVRWGALALAGMVAALGSVTWHEWVADRAADRALDEMTVLAERPPTRVAAAVRLTTDRGTQVEVREATDPRDREAVGAAEARFLDSDAYRTNLIRRQPANDRANCHGWVFTGGRYWVSGSDVDTILAENGYQPVAEPRPGDLVVYRLGGTVAHTAVVRYVTPGMPVLVEGKWGATGVYLHAAGASAYGTEFAYYRAGRASHALAGLDTPPVVAGGQ